LAEAPSVAQGSRAGFLPLNAIETSSWTGMLLGGSGARCQLLGFMLRESESSFNLGASGISKFFGIFVLSFQG
jgi:hypothetical protein